MTVAWTGIRLQSMHRSVGWRNNVYILLNKLCGNGSFDGKSTEFNTEKSLKIYISGSWEFFAIALILVFYFACKKNILKIVVMLISCKWQELSR